MKQENQAIQTPSEQVANNTNWVFIPLPKALILKRTDKYILFKVGDGSAIVSAKFKRAKEHEDMVFLSVPETYNFGVKYNEYDTEQKKFVTYKEVECPANAMKDYLSLSEEEQCVPLDKYIASGALPF